MGYHHCYQWVPYHYSSSQGYFQQYCHLITCSCNCFQWGDTSSDTANWESIVQANNLTYLGAFKLPSGPLGSTWGFGSGTGCCNLGAYGMTYNPARNSIFIGGHPYEQRLAEIAIPSSFTGTPTATALSNLIDPLEGKLDSVNPPPADTNQKLLGSALVYNNQLSLCGFSYYDGAV